MKTNWRGIGTETFLAPAEMAVMMIWGGRGGTRQTKQKCVENWNEMHTGWEWKALLQHTLRWWQWKCGDWEWSRGGNKTGRTDTEFWASWNSSARYERWECAAKMLLHQQQKQRLDQTTHDGDDELILERITRTMETIYSFRWAKLARYMNMIELWIFGSCK